MENNSYLPFTRFTFGTPWRKVCVGDPPDIDYHDFDDWVCPVRVIIDDDPQDEGFIADVVASHTGNHGAEKASDFASVMASALQWAFDHNRWYRENLMRFLAADAAFGNRDSTGRRIRD